MRRKPTIQAVKATFARDLAVAAIVISGGMGIMLNSVSVVPTGPKQNSKSSAQLTNRPQSNGIFLAQGTKLNKANAEPVENEVVAQQPGGDTMVANTMNAATTQYVQTSAGMQTIGNAAAGGQFMQGVWGNAPGATKKAPAKLSGKEIAQMLRESRARARAQTKQ